MISDDTEHTLFVAQALLSNPDDVQAFQKSLAWKRRLWLLGAPAGIGFATLKATLRLWAGFPPSKSGVFSAVNGPSMRSALIGAYYADNPARRKQYVTASTRITHTDARAEVAAQAVAEAAAWSLKQQGSNEELIARLLTLDPNRDWLEICQLLKAALSTRKSVAGFAASLGLSRRVTGYAYHSVPIALYAFLLQANDFRAALESALNCGGDTDTVGAITGALCGAVVGEKGIPREWVTKITDWPRSPSLLRRVGDRLAAQKSSKSGASGPVRYFWPGVIVRNIVFLVLVLVHGLRRLLPPY